MATCDTHEGLITLSDMLSPEEVNVIRLHQNRDGEEPLDYFPTELQTLIKAMAQEEKENLIHTARQKQTMQQPCRIRIWRLRSRSV